MVFGSIKSILANKLEKKVRKWCGIDNMTSEIETLRYIICNSLDIQTFPKATGLLRDVQVADTELLRIVHEVCVKHNLTYWLDWGTLLGAIRHKGFIPWDDDVDIAMRKTDYEKAIVCLKNELKDYEIAVYEGALINTSIIKVSIGNAGVNLDIFPRELIADDLLFPLQKMQFEAYSFFVPKAWDSYLQNLYGDYMTFPHKIKMHTSKKGKLVYKKSLNNNCDMNNIIKLLKNIVIN